MIRWVTIGAMGVVVAVVLGLNTWIVAYLPTIGGVLLCAILALAVPLYVIGNILWIFGRFSRRRRCREEWLRGDDRVTLRVAFRDGLMLSDGFKRAKPVALSTDAVGEGLVTLTVSTRAGTRTVVSGSIELIVGTIAKDSFAEVDHEGLLLLSSGSPYDPAAVERSCTLKLKECRCQPLTIAEDGWAAWEAGAHGGFTEETCRMTVAPDRRSLRFESS